MWILMSYHVHCMPCVWCGQSLFLYMSCHIPEVEISIILFVVLVFPSILLFYYNKHYVCFHRIVI